MADGGGYPPYNAAETAGVTFSRCSFQRDSDSNPAIEEDFDSRQLSATLPGITCRISDDCKSSERAVSCQCRTDDRRGQSE